MVEVRFDTYYDYAALSRILADWADAHPELCRLRAIGKSHEGREVWLLTVTTFATGPDDEKPALWVDGNIHASELAPSSACLYLIDTLVKGYRTDPDITRCLDTRAFYVCPRVNPDGAEWALETPPRVIRSSTRPYPYDEAHIEGLVQEDVDGDGRLLMMRIPDTNGAWKICAREPRLMVARDPTEVGGQYYRVLPEGRLIDYDGDTIKVQPPRERLDLNRNFPVNWRREHEQQGAGPYPTSEPEARNVVAFIAEHPNVTGAITFHTQGAVLLRPLSDQSDEAFEPEDLRTYKAIGARGTEITGYPAISVFHDFRAHPRDVITGAFDDWMFGHLGVFAWTVEIWSAQKRAGIEGVKVTEWDRQHPLEDDLKLLKWSDEVLGGRGYIDWYPVEHPQLGAVELGGWDWFYTFRNPPPHLLEAELAPFPQWLVWHLLISPRLELVRSAVRPLAKGVFEVKVALQNTGWLPTYITKRAASQKLVRGVVCELELPDDGVLQSGLLREDLGQLEGRAYLANTPTRLADAGTPDRVARTWILSARPGSEVHITARHPRAGTVRVSLDLK